MQSCLSQKYEALLLRDAKSTGEQSLQISYLEWLNNDRDWLDAQIIEEIKRFKDRAVKSAASGSEADTRVLGLIRGQEVKRLVWMTCPAGSSWISHIKSCMQTNIMLLSCMLSGRACLLVPPEFGQPASLTKRFIH
ncbi:hypothetical protein DKX38_014133 [Salix brachista]|uniref:Uncharacterized protein n=1 Tax=Salix brachista TaxID=2182728 RepID=A0A5N5LEJ9_9ROSI|nr:hypothetical protein DKX38_014133 [Salix brachista]